MLNPTGKKIVIAVWFALAFVVALGMSTTEAVDELGLFELDRNALDPVCGALPDDWQTLYGNPPGGLTCPGWPDSGFASAFTGILGDISIPGNQFQGGGAKDNNDITQWLWKAGEPLDKDDITNGYAAAYVYGGPPICDAGFSCLLGGDRSGCHCPGDLIVFYGLDRFANNGSAQVGFWFFQNEIGLTDIPRSGGFEFSGVHAVGDVLVQSNFSQGGVIDRVSIFEWVGSGGTNGTLNLLFSAADCISGATPNDPACATVNRGNTPSPWPYTPKFGTPGSFPQGSFFEGGINFSRLVPDAGCFTSVLAETRTSTPFDSRLKDFVLGSFDLCQISVVKTGDDLSKVGDVVHYTITVTNNGAVKLYKDDIMDSLLGDIAIDGVDQGNTYVISNSCGASLVAGASCTITLATTVQEGDPDPLINTVAVVYRGKADLSGKAVSASDDHSVNLFQPSMTVDKTGDDLSKVGDVVNYTITVDNTSSSDSPQLKCTISDSLLGINDFVMLNPGQSYVINPSRTVQEGDSDPLVNTVNVSCAVDGFPNVLEASASHSTNLFQPAIAAAKTGDTLSKVGDDVNYTVTLSNNSSADTPAMNCTAEDSLLGTLFSGVLPLGDTVINTSRTVQAVDPDPLVNTVTLTCSPEGFPNVLVASASHSTNLFQPSIAFDKAGDATLSKEGDTVNYTLTLDNTSSADTPNLTCTITDTVLGIKKVVNLASGKSNVTILTQVMPAAPDPYVNTAEVSCQVDGFSNVLTAADSWSVNLFQPAIAAAKTGDTLSKVGDEVNYTITLSNNSSADTPALNCVATDSLLGQVFNGVLPLGYTVINASRIVQAGDPDPLVNTVSVICSVTGFPNVLVASASHSTNLFQPAVEVIKTGPDTASIGETITYSFTINNLSSADSPDLILNSVTDTVLGDLTATAVANGCDILASGGTCSFTFNYTVQVTDPNPLVNVVAVHYNPNGFPNDITDDDDHTLLIPIQGCTPGFWQG
ncbi:MAG: hypothetical protein ACM34I_07465, partial [bacterium]